MHTVIYDGSFEGWLCAVFDVYDYKFQDVQICTKENFKGNIFENIHTARENQDHVERIVKGLQKKISEDAIKQVYYTFLSERPGIENILLQYVQYAFSWKHFGMENDFSNAAVLAVKQTAVKVGREKHRMEAFVRFQKTKDELYYAIIEPDFNVLPLIASHFKKRYADQKWIIYDARRKYGIYFDLNAVNNIELNFSDAISRGKNITSIYDETEEMYQRLWQQYFKSVNIAARKNTRLHIQHMPKRYWKYLPEKTAFRL